MKLPYFSSPTLIGLDIQPDAIYLLQISKQQQGLLIEQAIRYPLSVAIFLEGKIKRWDELQQALLRLLQDHAISNKIIALSLPVNLVHMQYIQVPIGLTEKEILLEIYNHIHTELPGMMEDLTVDFQLIEQQQSDYSKIFFATARQEYVSQYIQCVQATGLQVKIIDVDVYAIRRTVEYIVGPVSDPTAVHGIIYATDHSILLIIFDTEKIYFHQQWSVIEISELTQHLTNKLQIFQATFRQLVMQKIIVCGIKADQVALTSLKNNLNNIPVVILSDAELTAHWSLANTRATHAFTAGPHAFLLACGLAMRAIPIW